MTDTDRDGAPTRLFNVHIRDLLVHDDKDPGPGRGEYAVDFGAAGVPSRAGSRARVRWEGSVAGHRTYDVAQWTGVVAVPATAGKLTIGGAGAERDPRADDALLGGVATFEADREWGVGRWWRTVNGRDFDFVFCATPAEEAGEAGRPAWTGETYDAPGPDKLSAATFRSILGE
jgi:hypothetical protein